MSDDPKTIERERCALIVDGLANRFARSARRLQEENTSRSFWTGKLRVPPAIEKDVQSIDAVVRSLKTLVTLIRDDSITAEQVYTRSQLDKTQS